ncbi:hypothetical protein P7C70_g4371, partial [Phenoliferia sp. Uapishka_3]
MSARPRLEGRQIRSVDAEIGPKPEVKKNRSKNIKKLVAEAEYEDATFAEVKCEDLPPQGNQQRKSPPTLFRPMGGKGSGGNGQFVVADMDTLEKATFTTMCNQAEVNGLLLKARVQLHVKISWHAGFQALGRSSVLMAHSLLNAKSWISACGAEARDHVVKHYNLKLLVGSRDREFDSDSIRAATAALDSNENLRADGQAHIKDDDNLFLGSLLHTVAINLLGSGFSLPALMLDEGAAERADCLEVAFGVLGIAYAGVSARWSRASGGSEDAADVRVLFLQILRTLEHAKNGKGSYNFNEDYQQECGNLMLLARTLTVDQQNVVMLKLWALAGAHLAGLGRLATVAASGDAARAALFRRRA